MKFSSFFGSFLFLIIIFKKELILFFIFYLIFFGKCHLHKADENFADKIYIKNYKNYY